MPASRFLKYTGRNWPNPVFSFYLPVSTSWDDPVHLTMYFDELRTTWHENKNAKEMETEEQSAEVPPLPLPLRAFPRREGCLARGLQAFGCPVPVRRQGKVNEPNMARL